MKLTLKHYFSGLLAAVIFCGCLKTNDLYEGFNNLAPLADIALSHLSTDTLTVYALPVAASSDATIDTVVAVHLSAKNHVGDVTFQMGLGNTDSAFVAFMAAHPEYTLMPSNLYSFDSTVTIQNAGVLNTADFAVKFKTGAVDADGNNFFLSNEYVLPIIIKDAGGYQVASNFRMIIMRVLAKNMFDGVYNVTGHFTDLTTTAITDDQIYPLEGNLITASSNTVQFYDASNGVYGKVINSGGALSYYGGFDPVFTIDPVTGNVTSVVNIYGNDGSITADNSHGRSAKLNSSGINKYDFATKTLQVKYDMIQADLGGIVRATFDETYTYTGPR